MRSNEVVQMDDDVQRNFSKFEVSIFNALLPMNVSTDGAVRLVPTLFFVVLICFIAL